MNTSTTDLDNGVITFKVGSGQGTSPAIIGNQYIIIPYCDDRDPYITSYSGFTYTNIGKATPAGGGYHMRLNFYVATATETTMKWTDTDARCMFITFD